MLVTVPCILIFLEIKHYSMIPQYIIIHRSERIMQYSLYGTCVIGISNPTNVKK